MFLICVQAFRDTLCGELLHVQIFMNDGPNPLTWDAQLLSYWFSRNPAVFQDYLVNLITNLWGGHCFGSSRMRHITGGKITTFKLDHPVFDWHTTVHVPLMFLSEWREFPSGPCLAGKKTWWQLVSRCCWNCACHLTFPFSLCYKKRLAIRHMNRPLFPMTLLILPYDIRK